MRRIACVAWALLGCFDPKIQSGVPCSLPERECPPDQVCAADDRCYDPDKVPNLDGGVARCTPDETVCSENTLVACDGEGNVEATETCVLGCVDAMLQRDAHCAYLQPKFIPDVCDEMADEPSIVVSEDTTIDTSDDAICNGGIAEQPDGQALCILRHESLRIDSEATLDVVGSRAVAIVVDRLLEVSGTFDISAENSVGGPGSSGTTLPNAGISTGGGGAGFSQVGGAGGQEGDGGGVAGGEILDPIPLDSLIGGARGGGVRDVTTSPFTNVSGGRGGGAATLISCRDMAVVGESGVIDAGGEGGRGGRVTSNNMGGAGGGSGGHVVIQALDVQLLGRLYANGGGGGGGANGVDGNDGADGLRSSGGALGGISIGDSGAGGVGGSRTVSPGVGKARGADSGAGGGGGSAGYLRVVVPSNASPTISPTESSPALSPTEPTFTR